MRQLEICESRKKVPPSKKTDTDNKIKDTLPKRISSEKWRKKKQHKGPGYFQLNKKPKNEKGKLEDWQKVPIIPWGGNYVLPNGVDIHS